MLVPISKLIDKVLFFSIYSKSSMAIARLDESRFSTFTPFPKPSRLPAPEVLQHTARLVLA